ncbi:MAG: T9SS type A sorting domain-containing protein [Cryomorphaceae bacterium]|nr:T9SS type A sorting domain-containing protein [Cryomorphaceae bacterium]
MKNRLLPLIFTFLAVTSVNAQKCGTYDGYLEKQIQNYPDFYQKLQSQNQKLEDENKKALKRISAYKTEGGKKIIPVVVHNIYNDAGGLLSDAVIQAAIDALNRNINGQSEMLLELYQNQYLKTPDIFAAVRGIANVEFRLAKITPTCDTCTPQSTTGVNRIYTDITSAGSDGPDPVKGLSFWNSYQYLNIWTVPSFSQPGLLGYAQFPFSGMMSTDGVVLLASQMGSASSSTLTHEVGHWLGLRHIWGDAECGDDNIKDTPSHRYDNNGASESSPTPNGHPRPTPAIFPYHVGLSGLDQVPPVLGAWGCVADSLNPAGEMFMNYMDYTTDAYTTMFSAGQIEVVNITLEGEVDEESGVSGFGFREYMWSAENNIATGTSDGYFDFNDSCSTKYDFYDRNGRNFVCLGTENWLNSNSKAIGLDVTSASWDFGDGIVETSDYLAALGYYKKHTYTTAGTYDVTLMLDYNELREVRVSDMNDLDPSYDSLSTEVSTLIVQGTESELIAEGASNIAVHIDLDGYSKNSFWKRNQLNTDSILDASIINTLEFDSIVSLLIYVDSTNLSPSELAMLSAADSTWNDYVIEGYLDTIVDYNFQYNDTTVLNILTFIDSTFLSAADSAWLEGADSTWNIDGLLNTSDSIRIYFAQFNTDSIVTLSVNIDSTSLSPQDSLMFTTADSAWSIQSVIGGIDTLRTYYGQFNYYSYEGYYADTLFYRGELESTTYIGYYKSSCTSTTVKENYIYIGEVQATNTAYPYTYSFESENELNTDWVLTQPQSIDSEWEFQSSINTVWEWTSKASNAGNASIMIDGDNLALGSTEIVSPAYDLSDLTTPSIKFSWSGAASSTSPVNELNVSYSSSCGKTWSPLGTIDAINSANAGMYLSNFAPNASEWMDTVMTKTQLKNDNVMFKFEYVINGSSNNFYLDNIMIGEESELMMVENTAASRVSIYPNPTDGKTFIELNNLANKEIEVKLVNILGAEIMHLFSGEIVSNYYMINNIDLSHLETGIYFVKVVADGDIVMTDKLILK